MDSETPRAERSSRRATRATAKSGASAASRDHERGERSTTRAEHPPESSEEVGPLTVERHRKEDGRALLLYELRGDPR